MTAAHQWKKEGDRQGWELVTNSLVRTLTKISLV